MTDEELDEIQKRADAATPGPWRWGCWNTFFLSSEPDDMRARNTLEHDPALPQDSAGVQTPEQRGRRVLSVEDDGPSLEDRMFIAHAREDIPALIAEIRRLQPVCYLCGGDRARICACHDGSGVCDMVCTSPRTARVASTTDKKGK